MQQIAVAIFGPTGVGKTSLSLQIAKDHGEIISVDSMQIYKHLDIGTAKPNKSELMSVKHYLIDIISPDIKYSAADFKKTTEIIIDDLNKKKRYHF